MVQRTSIKWMCEDICFAENIPLKVLVKLYDKNESAIFTHLCKVSDQCKEHFNSNFAFCNLKY